MKKILRRRRLFQIILVMGSSLSLVLAACVPNGNNRVDSSKILKLATSGDPFLGSTSLVNPYYTSNPIANFFVQTVANLFTFRSDGDWKYDAHGKVATQPKLNLYFEGAEKLEIWGVKNQAVTMTSGGGETKKEESLMTLESSTSQGLVSQENLTKIQTKLATTATRVKLKINTKIPWVDKTGKIVQKHLVPKDYLDAFKMFQDVIKLGYNVNGYLQDLAGIDIEKTLADADNQKADLNNPYLNLILNTDARSSTLLSILASQSFSPVPSTNPKVKAILNQNLENNTKVSASAPLYISDGKFDPNQTLWDDVYGAGQKLQHDPDFWNSGAYYVNATSLQDISLKLNPNYFTALPYMLGDHNTITKKVPQVILFYGNLFGTAETQYAGFLTNDLSYVRTNTATKRVALEHFGVNSNQVQYAGEGYPSLIFFTDFNTDIYTTNKAGDRILKSRVNPSYEKFVNKYTSTDATTIRRSLFQLINWLKLGVAVTGPGQYNLNYNLAPFNAFDVPVEEDGKIVNKQLNLAYINGQKIKVKNPYENGSDSSSKITRSTDSNATTTSSAKMVEIEASSALGLPFKKYFDDLTKGSADSFLMTSLADFNSKKADFITALTNMGYTKGAPFKITLDVNAPGNKLTGGATAYYDSLRQSVNSLSDNLIDFNYNVNNVATRGIVFNERNSELAWSGWGPDFPYSPTWLTVPFTNANTNSATDKWANVQGWFKKLKEEEKKNYYSQGLSTFSTSTNLWPMLFTEMTKSGAPPWAKNLLETLKNNNIFKDKNSPKVNEYDASTKLLLVMTGWLLKEKYNQVKLNDFINSTYSFLPVPVNQGGPYTINVGLVNPNFKPNYPQYTIPYYRDWNLT